MSLGPRDSGFRPLLNAPAVPADDDAVVVIAEEVEVRVAGSPDDVGRILGLLDGTRTAGEVAETADVSREDVDALLEALAEHGAVTDCVDAWRRFHRESSTDSGLFRLEDDETLLGLMSERWTPATAETVALDPEPSSVRGVAEHRRSAPPDTPAFEVGFSQLSAVLDAMYGRIASGNHTVPSAGAFYPLVIQVLIDRPVGPLGPGRWLFDGESGELGRLSDRRVPPDELFIPYMAHDRLLRSGNPIVVISCEVERPARKYSNRAYRFALLEVGAAMQMGYLVGTELGLPVKAIGGVDDAAVGRLLETPPAMVCLLGFVLGA